MANEKKPGPEASEAVKKKEAPTPITMSALKEGCKFVDCKKKPEKFSFCMEHYELYMAGVVRGDGKKPLDYDKKLSQYLNKVPTRKVA